MYLVVRSLTPAKSTILESVDYIQDVTFCYYYMLLLCDNTDFQELIPSFLLVQVIAKGAGLFIGVGLGVGGGMSDVMDDSDHNGMELEDDQDAKLEEAMATLSEAELF